MILIAMPPGQYGAMHNAQWSTSVASWEATRCCHRASALAVLPWRLPWSMILNETRKHKNGSHPSWSTFLRYCYINFFSVPKYSTLSTKLPIILAKCTLARKKGVFFRVVYRIGIFRSVSVGISRYLPYRYQRKSRSVHFGIIFLAGTPFSLKKGALDPFLRKKGAPALFLIQPAPLLRKKGVPAKLVIPTKNTSPQKL